VSRTEIELRPVIEYEATRSETDDRPAVGSWWWVSDKKSDDVEWKETEETEDEDYEEAERNRERYDRSGKKWLACVIEVGSNYAKVEGVRMHLRIGLDDFHAKCKAEPNPDQFIDAKVSEHKGQVRKLMGEIQQICHQLGVPMHRALADAETPSQALAKAHSVDDIAAHKDALVKAKKETLPELFKKVKEQHEKMAVWMKAELIPAEAQLKQAQQVTTVIESKIHTVELYAGLKEELVQIREGDPADVNEKVCLMQRRHYMDEECLVAYEAGGMDFKSIDKFDAWLARESNFGRIFPHKRCVVAFRVRRWEKNYGELDSFIALRFHEFNKSTLLYIRNGQQLWRMETSVDFGEQLFPSKEDHDLLGSDELWVQSDSINLRRLITGQTRAYMSAHFKNKRRHFAELIKQWRRAGQPTEKWEYVAVEGDSDVQYSDWTPGSKHLQRGKPTEWHFNHPGNRDPVLEYERLTPTNIYYDDAMRQIAEAAAQHNRLAVVIQGLLDRSTCLHPHPPYRLWTPEGFSSGIVLVYDVSRALTPGEAPDFEGYRKQLNKSIKTGCHTIGQYAAWTEHMESKWGEKWRYHSRHGDGPDKIHQVYRKKRDGSCEYKWLRSRMRPKWVDGKPGYLKATWPEIETGWTCPPEHLTCVDAYTPGDFHMFFDDPRTRADYLKWAPILLACENWHERRRNPKPEPVEETDEGDTDTADTADTEDTE
jgi:hypothetical protein